MTSSSLSRINSLLKEVNTLKEAVRMSNYSAVSRLVCSRCGREYALPGLYQLCSCGGPLLAEYDFEKAASLVTKQEMLQRDASFWRYHELLPVMNPHAAVSMGETVTPLISAKNLGTQMGIKNLLIKNEGILPSGTFKARGAAIGISKVKEEGVTAVGIPTNGNAGAAWALYGARAGIKVTVVVPRSAPLTPRKESVLSGANVFVVDGTIGDAGNLVAKAAKEYGWYDVSTLKEPYRLEGKKTIGLEVAEQLAWRAPDVIVFPTGGGVGVIGIYKAFRELQQMGWIDSKMPRMVVVQAAGCAPLVRAFEAGELESAQWRNPSTVAFGMRVPKALGDFMILDVLRQTDGIALTVTDHEIMRELGNMVVTEGIHVSPEGAAAVAGARKLRESGWIRESEKVVVINTGSGLKYTDQIEQTGKYVDLDAMLPNVVELKA